MIPMELILQPIRLHAMIGVISGIILAASDNLRAAMSRDSVRAAIRRDHDDLDGRFVFVW